MNKSNLPLEYQQLIHLLRCAVGADVPKEDAFDWDTLLPLAKRHRVEALLYHVVKNMDNVPAETKASLRNEWRRMLARDARQEHTSHIIEKALTAEHIPYAPLKGLLLKEDYPSRELRHMSDLDYYIRPTDRDRIHTAMEKLGGTVASTDSGDINYGLPGRIYVEFHGMLLYRRGNGGVQSYSDWDRVVSGENRLTEEGYALNLIGHVIYNLASAGCGVRYILDLWIYRNRHACQPDWNAVMEQLKKDGLDEVAQNLLDLSEYWFGNAAGSTLLDELSAYVLEGGLCGLRLRKTLSAAGFQGGKLGAVKAQVFRSREEFENRYPWLKKHPYLLPVAWVMRGAKSLRIHREAMGQWTEQLKKNDRKQVAEQKARLRRFGFKEL